MQFNTTLPRKGTGLCQVLPLIFAVLLALLPCLQGGNPHLLMGNPSQAAPDPKQPDNFLMEKRYYALSYNNHKATPNWVSWRLAKEDIGSVVRKNNFEPDRDLPPGFVQVIPEDYAGGGFDRGHMCPCADRASDHDASAATFKMSNMVPQSPALNERAWEQLEAYCRDLVVNQGKTLYIVCGPAGIGGTGKAGPKKSIGQTHRVTVPQSCWKVIMVLDAGPGDDLDRIKPDTRLIAVIMPNDMSVGEEWAGFRVSVRRVEELTGYTFFGSAPAALIGPLKQEVDAIPIPSSMPHHAN